MKLREAFAKELERFPIIAPMKPENCQICGQYQECRCGVCFECKNLVETDMKEVWEITNPKHRWPYQYRNMEIDLS